MTPTPNNTARPTVTTRRPVDAVADTTIDAPPAIVFALVTDITRMGEWSPETVSARWLDGATHAAVGARFAGRNRLGRMRWTTKPTITLLDRDRLFEFTVPGKSGSTWRYELRPTATGGTHVTESVEQRRPAPAPIRFMLRRSGVIDRNAHLRDGMVTTLARLAAAAISATTNTTTNAAATAATSTTTVGAAHTHHEILA